MYLMSVTLMIYYFVFQLYDFIKYGNAYTLESYSFFVMNWILLICGVYSTQ